MEAGEYGSIINISSIGASLGFPNNPGYVASKGGLSALTPTCLDYGSKSIRVNTLVPGYIRTAMMNKVTQTLGNAQPERLGQSSVVGVIQMSLWVRQSF